MLNVISEQQLHIPHRLPGLNEFIAALNRNRFVGNQMKRDNTILVTMYARRLTPVQNPVVLEFRWVEQNAKRDPDNVVAGKKFILDGLVEAKILPNDTQKYILGFSDTWSVGEEPGVTILIKEVQDDRGIRTLGGELPELATCCSCQCCKRSGDTTTRELIA